MGGDTVPDWTIDNLDDARFVINVLHRRSVSDIGHINELYRRIAALEAPWYERLWRKLRG